MVAIRKSAGFAHILLLIVLLAIVAAVTLTVVKVIQNKKTIQTEREQYAKLDNEARAYIRAINAKYPGKVTHKSSCNYSSAKLGKGALGCIVETSIDYSSIDDPYKILLFADAAQKRLAWGVGVDNTGDDLVGVKKNMLYRGSTRQPCTVTYYSTQGRDELLIDASCGGPALAEYYPVIGN